MSNASPEPLALTAAAPTEAAAVRRGWSYVGTGAVAALSIAAAVAGDAILARAWSRSDFLLYNGVNRFLGLLVGVVCFQLGFGIVKECRNDDKRHATRVLANALAVSGGLWLASTALLFAFSKTIARFLQADAFGDWRVVGLFSVWLLGNTLLHVVVSWLRACREVAASNHLALFCRAVAVTSVAVLMLAIPGWVPGYYGVLGFVVAAGCLVPAFRRCDLRDATFDFPLCRRLVAFSSSRCADALLRQASLVALTMTLFALGRGEAAGELGILQMLIRGMESLFQPLVLLVLADSFALRTPEDTRRDVQRMWTAVVLFSIPATVGLMVCGELFLTAWLGGEYHDLSLAFQVTALSVLPTIGSVLLRGHLDSRWAVSPLAWINAAGIVVTAGAAGVMHACGADSLVSLSAMVVAVQWLQFGVQFLLLRQACGLRVYDGSAVKELSHRLVRLGRRARPATVQMATPGEDV